MVDRDKLIAGLEADGLESVRTKLGEGRYLSTKVKIIETWIEDKEREQHQREREREREQAQEDREFNGHALFR